MADFLQIRNWKSKDTVQCIEAFDPACEQQNDEMQFSNKRLTPHRHCKGTIVVFPRSFRQCPPAHRQILAPCPPFHAQTHNQIIATSIDISGSPLATEPPYFTFSVERNTHLELESTYTSRYGKASEGSSRLPPSNWGPNHTRSFQESSHDPCKHSVFGFRTVSLVGDRKPQPGPRPLCIRDFNPHRVADFKAGNGTRWNPQLIEGETSSSNLFLEQLGSPYRETITQNNFLATDMAMEANKVMLLSLEVVSTILMPHAGEQSFVEHEVKPTFTSSFVSLKHFNPCRVD